MDKLEIWSVFHCDRVRASKALGSAGLGNTKNHEEMGGFLSAFLNIDYALAEDLGVDDSLGVV